MSENQILAELRTIRTLLALDKDKQLNELLDGLSDIQIDILSDIDDNWSSISTADYADKHGVSKRTVQRQVGDLEELNFIEKKGETSGTEYRKTGLSLAAELVSSD